MSFIDDKLAEGESVVIAHLPLTTNVRSDVRSWLRTALEEAYRVGNTEVMTKLKEPITKRGYQAGLKRAAEIARGDTPVDATDFEMAIHPTDEEILSLKTAYGNHVYIKTKEAIASAIEKEAHD